MVEEGAVLSDLNSLGLVNLMNEKHRHLRQVTEMMWDEQSDIKISQTEWYIMYKIYGQKPTISDVSKNVTITRQATHKNIKSLQAKGLVEVSNSDHSKRDKCICLTKLGKQCCDKNEELVLQLENRISLTIGYENLKHIKGILQSDWGI